MKAPEHPHRLRTGFAGTPDFAASILRTLLDSPVQMAVAYTQPDRRAGRGQRQTGSPVKALAREHGLPIEQPHTLKDPSAVAQLRDYQLDVLVVAAYGLLLPPEVLSLPRLGCVNVHASLLPRWRGAAARSVAAGGIRMAAPALASAGRARTCPGPGGWITFRHMRTHDETYSWPTRWKW